MARLPIPGKDSGAWGDILNDYLSQAHKSDGALKDNVVTSAAIADNAVTAASIQDGSITEAQLDGNVQTKLNASADPPSWNDITDKPAVIAAGTDQAAARAAIGVDDVVMRPLGASYRPLKGVLPGITSTITTGTDTSGGVTVINWANRAGKYRFVGMNPVAFPSIPTLAVNDNTGIIAAGNPAIYNPIVVEFWSNATDIRVHYYSIARGDVWAIVDDARIVDGTYLHGNIADGNATWKLTQSSAVWRKWRLCLPTTGMTAIAINAGAGIAETTKGFQLCVIGNSYIQGGINIANAVAPGTSGIIASGTPIGEFEQETGLDIWRCGVSGSGYIADAGLGASLGPYGSSARMNGLAALPDMDAIVVWGTANDQSFTTSAITSAASAMWTAIKAARPDTPLIVAGVECAPSYPVVSTTWVPMNTALKTAAESHTGVASFIDFMEHSWMTGTGNEGGPTGDGNADYFMSSDFIHLTHPGNRYWGQHVARLFASIPLPVNKSGGSF